ncbi:Protein VACUOLELESS GAMETOPHYTES [Cardamine amara subsp. amara]|uniref:Protein VACUOLELESS GAMETOPHYTES n=1 Tax=Cardamine amara subsp. amara TaxID=228776 RepID=A0ABD1BFR4_CARAN
MDSVEHFPPSRLICPAMRIKHNKNSLRKIIDKSFYLVIDSSYYFSNAGDDGNNSARSHHMSLLYWCNNKESEENFRCGSCQCRTIGTTYYFCNECNLGYHKECVESPPLIKSLFHPKHHLQLVRIKEGIGLQLMNCCYCGSSTSFFSYYCFICRFSLGIVCEKKPTFLSNKKMHEHVLNYFPRKNNLICDACGVVDNESLTYVCLQCDFIVHKSCIYLPFVIRISRHDHRLSFTFSHPSKNLSCGVCRQKIGENYGKYFCVKGCTYEVHSKCATRRDVWNGIELEDEPEEEVYESINSFEVIGDGIIQVNL